MNNPPAFPLTNNWHNELKHYNGMTLRDYFAAKAMQAMLAHPDSKETAPPQTYANASYIMADAMLKAREA
jgi:hypothetical protein